MLSAYFDESGFDGPTFVLCGFVATEEMGAVNSISAGLIFLAIRATTNLMQAKTRSNGYVSRLSIYTPRRWKG